MKNKQINDESFISSDLKRENLMCRIFREVIEFIQLYPTFPILIFSKYEFSLIKSEE